MITSLLPCHTRTFVLIGMLLLPLTVSAGGSWEQVTVESLTLLNSTDYELAVHPEPINGEYKDPYMGNCSRFTVKGSYSWIHSWRFPEFVTQENHKAALAYLRQAHGEKKAIFFGWMGTGFVAIDPANQCVVRSRALHLFTDAENGVIAVISYHDAP